MQLTSYPPSEHLAPFVRAFAIVETADEATRVLIPEPGIVLGFRYRGFASLLDDRGASILAPAGITGVAGTVRHMRTSAGGGAVLAIFHPAGAAQFFAQPLHELFGTTAMLGELVPPRIVEGISSRLAETTTHAQRIALIEQFLLSRLEVGSLDRVVVSAVRAIQEARGAIRIRALARALAVSQDPLEKRFRRAVGTSPKQLASLIRLRHAIGAYRPGASLARLSHEAGYFDQSHFIRDFRALTGQAPGRFFLSGDHC